MNMLNNEQIAREADSQICEALWKAKAARGDAEWPSHKIQQIILAAIEKVDEKWRDRFRKFEKIETKFGAAKQRPAAQPQRSVYADSCYEAEKGIRLPASNIYDAATNEQRVTELEKRMRNHWDEILKLWQEIGYKNPK